MPDIIAIKSIKQQPFEPTPELIRMMEIFRKMINDCIRIGLEHDVSTMKQLCSLAYQKLSRYDIISYYKLCAISHAAGILANRRKSIKRGLKPRRPYTTRPMLISCYGFKFEDGMMKIPLGNKRYYNITLTSYVKNVLSNTSFRIHSFLLSPDCLSVCYSDLVAQIACENTSGIDRNLHNVTVGNRETATQFNLSKAVEIAENTRSVKRSFKRNDVRIRRKLYQKYGMRKKQRINQLLHRLTKTVVEQAKQSKTAVAFEDITHIRRLYRKGNYQGRTFRARLNGWSFSEVKHQIEYKARWEGIPVIQLSKSETRGTSQLCPQCGKKITQVDRLTRQPYCAECNRWVDRDIAAAMNISIKGLARFASSKGLAGEANGTGIWQKGAGNPESRCKQVGF
jgi:putative transposase